MAIHTTQSRRLDPLRLPEISLDAGHHASRAQGVCVMEAAAWLAGEPHTDHPRCVSPVTAEFCRAWNDALPDDAARNRLLRPLLVGLLDTRTTAADEEVRAWLATDWLVRVNAPAWMDLSDALRTHGDALRGLAPLTDDAAARAAQPTIEAAGRAAGRTAGRAAGLRVGSAAWRAAWRAAGRAAGRAAETAAGSAAWLRVGSAAWRTAARAAETAAARAAETAAGSAAWLRVGSGAWRAAETEAEIAAEEALRATVERLQSSAVDLVRAMCAVGRESAS